MSKLNVTASTSFALQKLKWKSIKGHNNRGDITKREAQKFADITPKQFDEISRNPTKMAQLKEKVILKERAEIGKSVKHGNQYINTKYTKYNKSGRLMNYYKFMNNKALHADLHRRNVHYKAEHQITRMFVKAKGVTTKVKKIGADKVTQQLKLDPKFVGLYRNHMGLIKALYDDPRKYLKSKNFNNTRCGVITLGDTDFRKRYEAKQVALGNTIGQARISEAHLLTTYMKQFNQRHKYIKIGGYAIHNDEGFIHAHAEYMAQTTTKSGKFSFSFSKAIHDEVMRFHQGMKLSNKQAMHVFHHDEDRRLVHTFNTMHDLKLVRKGVKNARTRKEHAYMVSCENKASSAMSTVTSATSQVTTIKSKASSYVSSYKSSAVSEAQPIIKKDFNSARSSVASASASNLATANSLSNMKIVTREQYKQARQANNEARRLKTKAMNKLKKAYKAYSARLDAKYNKMKQDIIMLKARYIQPLANRFDSSTLGKKWQNVNPFNHARRARNITTNNHLTEREREIRRSRRSRGPQI